MSREEQHGFWSKEIALCAMPKEIPFEYSGRKMKARGY